ncbi:enoyl-CoA hydratase/isomerase family protein [Flavobacterium sp. U410]
MEVNNYKSIIAEVKNNIGFIYLNRPDKLNAINVQMRLDIVNCLSVLEADESIKVIVFAGVGKKSFSVGFDLDEFKQVEKHNDILKSSTEYHLKVWNCTKPTIAMIDGYCMGGGMDLATLCDIRLCTNNSTFGHPEIKFEAPPLITPLKWIVGDGRAKDLILTGRKINAEQAFSMGFLTDVVASEETLNATMKIAETISSIPNATMRLMKSYMDLRSDFETAFAIEHDRAFKEIILPLFKSNE